MAIKFPLPKSLMGFASQSLYMAKQFTNRWYTTKFKSPRPNTQTPNYLNTVKPTMTLEKKLVYEMFVLHNIPIRCNQRKIFYFYVSLVKDQLTVELKRDLLEVVVLVIQNKIFQLQLTGKRLS